MPTENERNAKYMTTADAKATQEAKELLEYLKNTAGQQIITGQHTQTIPCEEIAYIRQVTGKEPKLRGFELLAYSPNINYADASPECLKEVEENKGTVETALQWARANRPHSENGTGYADGGYPHLQFPLVLALRRQRQKLLHRTYRFRCDESITGRHPGARSVLRRHGCDRRHPATFPGREHPHPLAPLPRILRHLVLVGSEGRESRKRLIPIDVRLLYRRKEPA